jgi:hypothetical protein
MSFDDPGDDIFGHLDDPRPPMYGDDSLTHVVQRGAQIRRRRRAGYALTSAAAVVAIGGAAFAVAASKGPNGGGTQITNSQTPTPSGSAHHKKHQRPHSPGVTPTGISSVPAGGNLGHHHHHHHPVGPVSTLPPVCTTPTPSATPTPDPSATPTSTDSPAASDFAATVSATCPPTPAPSASGGTPAANAG